MAFDALMRPVDATELPYTYTEDCPVQPDNLALVRFIHCDFEGKDKVGEIILNRLVTGAFIEVMKVAYEVQYPIHQAVVMDHPAIKGNDEYSMEANNTSGFNYRRIAGTDRISNHSYGLAIDINPLMNPYLASNGIWYPSEGQNYLARDAENPGVLHETHDVVLAFMERGFEWGGLWDRPDYHHFEFSDNSL